MKLQRIQNSLAGRICFSLPAKTLALAILTILSSSGLVADQQDVSLPLNVKNALDQMAQFE